ncbi:MAG: bifunctional folylpolyglutamate synthase/dihydrofolate synthase [Desulfobacteraceae bacterium]|nr:bifunctional folylpolyglutamate synthase/dihydrofolate synthase [Desulfobacteraceae bacterium]
MRGVLPPEYEKAVSYIYGLQKFGIKFGLNSTRNMLDRLGNPQQSFRSIHIAGTNGKGSTAAMLSSILKEHGFRVGLYTSPHLVRFAERFQVDNREAEPERILAVFQKIRPLLYDREPPTFFELVTAMAFLYFAEEGVDWAVVEVGMGGRLDATNVILPEVSVITTVSFDHQEYLGNTLPSIAREKAGIIKEGVPVVTGAHQPSVQGVLKTACMRHGSPLYRLGTNFRVRRNPNGSLHYQGLRWQLPDMEIGLIGPHQAQNAATAVATLEVLEKYGDFVLDREALAGGLASTRWPARLEVLQRQPLIVLDGAHNVPGAEALREALKRSFAYRRLHLVLGVMADKDIKGIFRRLLPLAETVIFTQPRYARAASAEELKRIAGPSAHDALVIPDPASAIERARLLAHPEDLICITGSLYFAGEVKEIFGEPSDHHG